MHFFNKYHFYLMYKMGPKKAGNNVRIIKVPTDTPTKLELRDAAADMQMKREEAEKQQREERERKPGGWKLHRHRQRSQWLSESKMNTEGGGDASASTEFQSGASKDI